MKTITVIRAPWVRHQPVVPDRASIKFSDKSHFNRVDLVELHKRAATPDAPDVNGISD